jgi:hypothetical protein
MNFFQHLLLQYKEVVDAVKPVTVVLIQFLWFLSSVYIDVITAT